ncbi:MAG: hypothetical protein GX418_03595, partial [Clostridiales bacterium]|nr:hypothetical protein [Clostridiales bacterium]
DDQGGETPPTEQSRTEKAFEFCGSYSHAIDIKGRVIIPNAYRQALGTVFTVGPTRDFKAIALYPDPVFNQIRDELNAMNQRKPFVQDYLTQFFKLSYRDMQTDGQGRILLPPKLRQRLLGEARELEISGISNHVRMIDAEKAAAADRDFDDRRVEIMEQMGDLSLI